MAASFSFTNSQEPINHQKTGGCSIKFIGNADLKKVSKKMAKTILSINPCHEILIFKIFFFRGEHLHNTSRMFLATPTLHADILLTNQNIQKLDTVMLFDSLYTLIPCTLVHCAAILVLPRHTMPGKFN